MRKSKFTDEQILKVLKEVEACVKVQDVVRRLGITETTFYRWKAKFGGLEVSEAKRLRALADENRKLKTLVADLTLEKQALQHLLGKRMVGPAALRLAADELRAGFAMKKRRVCRIVGLAPATYYYRARRPERLELRGCGTKTSLTLFESGLGLIRFGGQFDYAACLSVNRLSNSAGLTYPIAEWRRCRL